MHNTPRTAVLALAAAGLAALLLVSAPVGYRLGVLPLDLALRGLVPGGVAAAAVAIALGVFTLLRSRPGPGSGRELAAASIALSLFIGFFPVLQAAHGRGAPLIHDISTDLEDVPAFVALAAARADAPNGLDYEGPEVARQQRDAYPDIQTLHSRRPPAQLHDLALRLVRARGWELAADEPGRIEATAATPIFGLKDDVVIRIRPEGDGSRVDLRSMSRLGHGDLGLNAARVRGFLAALQSAGA